MKLLTLAKLAAASTIALAAVANATPLNFSVTGAYTASWTLDSSPTPDVAVDGVGFILYDVVGNFPGSLLGLADLTFYAADADGGIQIDDFYGDTTLLITDGGQLYTGTEDAPVFSVGSYALTDYLGSGDTYTLTISAVPEPATVATMLAGLGLIGVAMRRRKTTTKTEDEAVAA